MDTASSVSLRLPSQWLDLDPRAEDVVAELRRALGDRFRAGIGEDQLLSLLSPLAVEVRNLAATQEIILVGLYTDVIPVDDEAPVVITAHAVLAVSPPLGDVDTALREMLRPRDDGSRLTPVTLPAGDGVRDEGPTIIRHPEWTEPVEAYQWRFCVPVPGYDRMAVLSFLTPNVELAEPFGEVFEAVAQTLSFHS